MTIAHRVNWTNLLVLLLAHVLAVGALVYLFTFKFSWWTIALGIVWTLACGFSITGGYHRLFAHASYRASPLVRVFYLLFGAAAVQNSVLSWAGDHRIHHAKTNREGDPYDSRRGFWWSHLGWVLYQRDDAPARQRLPDLEASPLLRWQDRHYVLLAILMAGVVPALLGLLWGDPIGAVLVAGFLRLVFQWHVTFSINSLAHLIGARPFCSKSSARDNPVLALVTLGEGYHNYHHRFPVDYRNGVRWYHFDATKWFVWLLSRVGLTRELRRAPVDHIKRARREVVAVLRGLARQ